MHAPYNSGEAFWLRQSTPGGLPEAVSAASGDRHGAGAAFGNGLGPHEAASGRSVSRVLIVDDDATTGPTLARLLTIKGFEASSVQLGTEGLERAFAGACDALVLDLHLPDLPGLSVLATLRASGSDMPVVPVTGHYLDEHYRHRAQALGVSAFLYKPLIDDELAQALRRATSRPVGSLESRQLESEKMLESVLVEAERRVHAAYARMPREAIVDAVHDAVMERAVRGDLHILSRASLVARITASAWRNMANAWRAHKTPQDPRRDLYAADRDR